MPAPSPLRHALLALPLTLLVAAGCERRAPAAPPGELKEGTSPPDRCDAERFAAQARELLSGASNACASAEDCECYAGTLLGNCGGVADRATADRINALSGEASSAGCPVSVQCAARRCAPVCEQGRCR